MNTNPTLLHFYLEETEFSNVSSDSLFASLFSQSNTLPSKPFPNNILFDAPTVRQMSFGRLTFSRIVAAPLNFDVIFILLVKKILLLFQCPRLLLLESEHKFDFFSTFGAAAEQA